MRIDPIKHIPIRTEYVSFKPYAVIPYQVSDSAQSGAGAIRLYHEAGRDPGMSGRVEVPTAIAMPLRDGITVPAPRSWAERFYAVHQWTVMERGGHFPEWEIPDELACDIRKFFSELRV